MRAVNSRPTSTRDIARSAVRSQLALAAFDLIEREGFANVTVTDLAVAGGVSRSTFLRYFDGKEDAILSAFDAQGEQAANALLNRPKHESDWTALRGAFGPIIDRYREDPDRALAITHLIWSTPALRAGLLERQHLWLPGISHALAERSGLGESPSVAVSVKCAAALDCLNIAIRHWTASEGRLSLIDLLDEAFAALTDL